MKGTVECDFRTQFFHELIAPTYSHRFYRFFDFCREFAEIFAKFCQFRLCLEFTFRRLLPGKLTLSSVSYSESEHFPRIIPWKVVYDTKSVFFFLLKHRYWVVKYRYGTTLGLVFSNHRVKWPYWEDRIPRAYFCCPQLAKFRIIRGNSLYNTQTWAHRSLKSLNCSSLLSKPWFWERWRSMRKRAKSEERGAKWQNQILSGSLMSDRRKKERSKNDWKRIKMQDLYVHILIKNYGKQRLIVVFSILPSLFHNLCVLEPVWKIPPGPGGAGGVPSTASQNFLKSRSSLLRRICTIV